MQLGVVDCIAYIVEAETDWVFACMNDTCIVGTKANDANESWMSL